jgi:hypothetical protein
VPSGRSPASALASETTTKARGTFHARASDIRKSDILKQGTIAIPMSAWDWLMIVHAPFISSALALQPGIEPLVPL